MIAKSNAKSSLMGLAFCYLSNMWSYLSNMATYLSNRWSYLLNMQSYLLNPESYYQKGAMDPSDFLETSIEI
ncbi:hypothetical protein [Saccharococcus sp. Marseille-Q5394]|uniref:hypothetical protein n=1 Tax=Saccharococcus sp. Marseille-Q5394 TaxID=2972778 RepID=UPI0021C6BADC|nr:hypothetical protein [Saccharococcus sp. Marseille-Q5394]